MAYGRQPQLYQQQITMAYLSCVQSQSGSQYPVMLNSTEEDDWGVENVELYNAKKIVIYVTIGHSHIWAWHLVLCLQNSFNTSVTLMK